MVERRSFIDVMAYEPTDGAQVPSIAGRRDRSYYCVVLVVRCTGGLKIKVVDLCLEGV